MGLNEVESLNSFVLVEDRVFEEDSAGPIEVIKQK